MKRGAWRGGGRDERGSSGAKVEQQPCDGSRSRNPLSVEGYRAGPGVRRACAGTASQRSRPPPEVRRQPQIVDSSQPACSPCAMTFQRGTLCMCNALLLTDNVATTGEQRTYVCRPSGQAVQHKDGLPFFVFGGRQAKPNQEGERRCKILPNC